MDAIHVKVRDGAVVNRPFYAAIVVDLQRHRDVLGIRAGTPGTGESSKFWISILTELKNRGVVDIFYLVCDGLKGMSESGRDRGQFLLRPGDGRGATSGTWSTSRCVRDRSSIPGTRAA